MAAMSETFWMFLIATSTAFVISVIKMCYKSKCSEVDLLCFKLKRDVVVEEKELEFITNHHKDDSDEETKH